MIGLGCFVELFAIAASHLGYRADITLFPQGEPGERLDDRPIAHLRLVPDSGIDADPLFAHVLRRHTNRSAYDTTRSIDSDTLQAITAVADSDVTSSSVEGGPLRASLRDLTRAALRDEILDTEAFQESVDLMRIGRAAGSRPFGCDRRGRGPMLGRLSARAARWPRTCARPSR